MINFFKKIISARTLKKKEFLTSEEFIAAIESDFNREMDINSKAFFRSNTAIVNIINRVANHKLRTDKGGEIDKSVVDLILLSIEPYLTLPSYNSGLKPLEYKSDLSPSKLKDMHILDILEKFKSVCPEAGNICTQTITVYFNND